MWATLLASEQTESDKRTEMQSESIHIELISIYVMLSIQNDYSFSKLFCFKLDSV